MLCSHHTMNLSESLQYCVQLLHNQYTTRFSIHMSVYHAYRIARFPLVSLIHPPSLWPSVWGLYPCLWHTV